MMLELIEAVSGRLICPKSWNRIVVIFEAHCTVYDCDRAVLNDYFINYEINCIVMGMRPVMAVKFGFTK